MLLLTVGTAAIAPAQLRPLDPLQWEMLTSGASVSLTLGVEAYRGQRASLAGVEGVLWEVGSFRAGWRTGRVLLEASGTPLRRFHDERVFAEPHGGARPARDGWRSDAGDFRVSTAVRLTPTGAPSAVALRFGTRLPTTDNRVGLERDRTDFFALVGGRTAHGPWSAAAEAGVGIHGTREPDFEQSDVLIFMAGAGYRGRGWAANAGVVGHADGMPGRAIRGSEELAELRLRLRAGESRRVWVEAVRGLTQFSPDLGGRFGVSLQL